MRAAVLEERDRAGIDGLPVHLGARHPPAAALGVLDRDGVARRAGAPVDRESLRDRNLAADYLVITHNDFLQQVNQFADVKRTAGFTVRVVTVHEIYDQFSAGQETPLAIKAFLRYAANNWKGSRSNAALTYVLLVGDCTSAYRNEFRNNIRNYVPSYIVGSVGSSDRHASDSWFACINGDDLLPDLVLGRISVQNTKDLQAVLDKQYSYRSRPAPGSWQNTLGFVGDHSEFEGALLNVMRDSVPGRFFRECIWMGREPWIDNYYFPSEIADIKKAKVSPATTRKIHDLFNRGAAVITYFGHGSPNVWSNERIWFGGESENSDNLLLTNADRLPLIITMTCNTGAIDYPKERWHVNISEDMMRQPRGGAVACYVPTGPGVTAQHERYTIQLNRALLQENIKPANAAFLLANWRYLLNGQPPDLPKMFVFLGDPSLELVLPDEASQVGIALQNENGQVTVPVQVPTAGGYYQLQNSPSTGMADNITTLPGAVSRIDVPAARDISNPIANAAIMLNGARFLRPTSFGAPVPNPSDWKIESVSVLPRGVVPAGSRIGMHFPAEERVGQSSPKRLVRVA